MYQFTNETVINSNLDSNGTSTMISGSAGLFSVLRAGNFKTAEVTGCYKTAYSASLKEIVKATIAGTYTATKIYRLAIEAKLSGSANSEFASAYPFGTKKWFYEFTGADTAAEVATACKNAIDKENTMTGFKYFTPTISTGELTITAANEYIRFTKVEVQELLAATAAVPTGEMLTGYNNFTVIDNLLALAKAAAGSNAFTAGKLGFGNTAWMLSNLRIPTYENTRFAGIGMEERPIPGAEYTQYTITTSINRPNLGMGVVGASAVSTITNVFYVISTVVSAFEAALIAAGIAIDTVATLVTAISITNDTKATASTFTHQIVYTTTPENITGASWTLVSVGNESGTGAPDATKISVSKTGLITALSGHGLAATDVLTLTAVIDGVTFTGKTVTIA